MTFIQSVKNEIVERNARSNETKGHEAINRQVQQYVSDVFLTCASGGIKQGYHIDFTFDDLENARSFCDILGAYDILPKLTHRGDLIVVYIKSREDICNLLALIGASKALMDLNNEIALREVRGNANRRANCDSGNIAKQVATAREQVEVIKGLDLERLDSKLREVAVARVENPEASYEELAEGLKISKSCLVHRMRRVMSS